MTRTAAGLAAASLVLTATTALAQTPGVRNTGKARSEIRLPVLFASQVASTREGSTIPLLLPDKLTVDIALRDPSVSGDIKPDRYSLELGATRSCGGATACFIAAFIAQRGAKLSGSPNVRLRNGVVGRYTPFKCGASCGPSAIEWRLNGAIYTIQIKGIAGTRASMITLANAALKAGRR